MTTANIIATIIVVIAIISIISIRLYTYSKKNNKKITLDAFMDIYGEQIIAMLKDVVLILQINIDEFDSKEEYERVIINTTIDTIKDNCSEMDIDSKIINLFDTEALGDAIYKLFNGEKLNIFSVLKPEDIANNTSIYEEEVVIALTSAKELDIRAEDDVVDDELIVNVDTDAEGIITTTTSNSDDPIVYKMNNTMDASEDIINQEVSDNDTAVETENE